MDVNSVKSVRNVGVYPRVTAITRGLAVTDSQCFGELFCWDSGPIPAEYIEVCNQGHLKFAIGPRFGRYQMYGPSFVRR